MKITIEYPTAIKVITKTEAEMRALGYKNFKGDKFTTEYVNRPQVISVRTNKPVRTLEQMCLDQTGMTPSAYQAKFNRAWNA